MCGLLRRAMHGARDAAHNWEAEHTEMRVEAGFTQGSHSARAPCHKEKNIRIVVHGDDFTVLGGAKELDWLRGKTGEDGGEVQRQTGEGKPEAVRILNRIVTVTERGLGHEAD